MQAQKWQRNKIGKPLYRSLMIHKLQCEHKNGKETACTGTDTGHQPSKIFKSSPLNWHPSNKQNQAGVMQEKGSRENSKRGGLTGTHLIGLSIDP
uniref:Putative ovule protein n=1 Tax=Solanum chacoense TaxID=4108 RepID=A0A0V0IEE5_SOLCH